MKFALLTLALAVVPLQASTVTPCNDPSITSVFLPGSPGSTGSPHCSLGNLGFGLFSVSTSGSATGAGVAIGSGSYFDSNTGKANLIFQLTGVNSNTLGDIIIHYLVTGWIDGLDITLGNSQNTVIREIGCTTGFSCGTGDQVANMFVNGANPYASVTFAPVSQVFVDKDVSIGALRNGQLIAGGVSDFTNGHSTPVPEPSTYAYLVSGIMLIGAGCVPKRWKQPRS